MRIVVDLDGTVCEIRKPDQKYEDVEPKMEAVKALQELKSKGHTIILYTARHMKTCDANVGKVMARIGNLTIAWLHKHNVPFDEIYFGKPWGDLYIDDQALRPDWKKILKLVEDGSK